MAGGEGEEGEEGVRGQGRGKGTSQQVIKSIPVSATQADVSTEAPGAPAAEI